MVAKLGVSVTEEVNRVLDLLAEESSLAKSRLIDNLLREHPRVRQKLAEIMVTILHCSQCNAPLTSKDVKIDTPKYGTLCLRCWSSKAGRIVEYHPVSDNESSVKD